MATGIGVVPDTAWFKSSYSGANETECVEAAMLPGRTAVRDSKHPTGPLLSFRSIAWADFATAVGRHEL
ncbi:DUF397 domain-containing protein [Streptomyces sp. NPDC087859]|uniref:DUF397 domain-containing protein n=1 Tax=Streptomyces sp. NPDC087859 TaxID=3365812 RepID=UPI00382385F2